MVIFIIIIVGVVVLLGAYLFLRYFKKEEGHLYTPKNSVVTFSEEISISLSFSDIIKLAYADFIVELNFLLKDNKEELPPHLQGKIDELTKQMKEHYYQNLLDALTKGREQWVEDALKKADIGVQDVLLKIFMEIGLDNKTMAQMLLVSVEALKKRKSRLYSKWK